jgi:D-amino-acid oxidase
VARVVVVGAGVIGLSCAVRLLEEGHDVAVVARDLPAETTSAVAAALWYPYLAQPLEKVTAWATTTRAELTRLADDEESGVVLRDGTEVLRTADPVPWWAAAVPELAPADELPEGYVAGRRFEAPVVEMARYLPWLAGQVESRGGTLTRMALPALPDLAEVVVNAAGIGARRLAADPTVVPVRGQVVYVEQVGLERWWLDAGGPEGQTYVIPRSKDIVVGGTEEEGEWDRAPDRGVAAQLLARACELVPELRGARVTGHRVGLRPARPTVRLEAEELPSGCRVVHCYGHGGSGVTVSWGCADEVAALVTPS